MMISCCLWGGAISEYLVMDLPTILFVPFVVVILISALPSNVFLVGFNRDFGTFPRGVR